MIELFLGRRLIGKFPLLPSFAAAMSFYFLVSLVPFLVVVSRLAAWLFSANLTPELAGFLREVLPPESLLRPETLIEAVNSDPRSGLGIASTFMALWTASSGLNEMARAVHYLFSDPDRPQLGGFGRWLKAFGLLAIWAAAIGSVALGFVLIPAVEEHLARIGRAAHFPSLLLHAGIRYGSAAALVFVAFLVSYAFIPEERTPWRPAAVGAALATAVWCGVSLVFAWLLPSVWHVSLFSGALGSAVAVLMWAYGCAWGVLLGAALAARLDDAQPAVQSATAAVSPG